MADVEGWEARMAARARARRGDDPGLESVRAEQRAAHPEWFSPDPPADDACRACHTWKISDYQSGRYAWYVTCPHLPGGDGQPCPCCHCDEAVLLA